MITLAPLPVILHYIISVNIPRSEYTYAYLESVVLLTLPTLEAAISKSSSGFVAMLRYFCTVGHLQCMIHTD